jgi:tellurium resistance protein TerD
MCEREISPNAVSCPHCGEPMKKVDEISKVVIEEVVKDPICEIVLLESGRDVIRLIKEIRTLRGCDLAEAKSKVDNIPSVIMQSVVYSKAREYAALLSSIGAKVEIVSNGKVLSNYHPDDNTIKCPQCGSTQITGGTKGFGLGKAAAGGILLGPVGLLGGMIGSKKTMVTCLKCGKKWEAGR